MVSSAVLFVISIASPVDSLVVIGVIIVIFPFVGASDLFISIDVVIAVAVVVGVVIAVVVSVVVVFAVVVAVLVSQGVWRGRGGMLESRVWKDV